MKETKKKKYSKTLNNNRLVDEEERQWTDETLDEISFKHFPNLDKRALDRPILFSNWLTREYSSVGREELRSFVKARLKVFSEEELDVQLVIFNEVLDHILRIDRVFKQPQGKRKYRNNYKQSEINKMKANCKTK
jgi:dynein heavy chain 1